MYRHQLGENLLWSHLGLKAKGLSGLRYVMSVSYTHLRAHETDSYLVCRLLLEKKQKTTRAAMK